MLIKVCRSLSVKNCHAKRKGSNSEALFAVAVMTGELIVGRKKFLHLHLKVHALINQSLCTVKKFEVDLT